MDMVFLDVTNIHLLVEFEKKVRASEPHVFLDDFDEVRFATETANALHNPLYVSAKCLMCADKAIGVIGRLDFSILYSYAFGGGLRIYVDWVCVLKAYRHKKIAQLLFAEMENYIKKIGVNEYFLISAANAEAQNFYHAFENAEINQQTVLTKTL